MKRIFFRYRTGYFGEDGADCLEFDDGTTDDELSNEAYNGAIKHASRYGHDLCDCDDDECDAIHEGNHNIEGSWEVYGPKKHDLCDCDDGRKRIK